MGCPSRSAVKRDEPGHAAAAEVSREQKRQALADKSLDFASGALAAIALPEGQITDLDDIRTVMVSVGICIDKVQRLMGDAMGDEDQVIEIDLGSVRRAKEGEGAG